MILGIRIRWGDIRRVYSSGDEKDVQLSVVMSMKRGIMCVQHIELVRPTMSPTVYSQSYNVPQPCNGS